jgi:ubiquinone biosynthesis protein
MSWLVIEGELDSQLCYSDGSIVLEGMLAVTDRAAGSLNAWHLNRYREILGVLMRFGLSDFVENLGRGRITQPRISPAALRGALIELGPAFIKLGQILSTRDEILPAAFRDELATLHDQVPAFPAEVAAELIQGELGLYPFLHFDPLPLAVGSIGQVHHARLADGTEVAVKVQRPGVEEVLARDSAIIRHLSDALGGQPRVGDHAARLVTEFIAATESELDYRREADQLERFAWQFEHEPAVQVPRLIREYCSRRVLTMTYVPGTKLSQCEALAPEFDRAATARRLGSNVLKQVFAFGYFHGDPHPANVFVRPDHSIGFYDLGLVGELSRSDRECLGGLLLGLVEQDADAAMDSLLVLSRGSRVADPEALRSDVTRLMTTYFRRLSPSTDVQLLLSEILAITTRHGLTLPPGFYLAFKVLATLDTVGRRLDPSFDLPSLALPFLRRAKPSQPAQLDAAEALDFGLEALAQLRGLPAALKSTFDQLHRGQLRIQFEHRGPELRQEFLINRLSAALLSSAALLGSLVLVGFALSARMISLAEAGVVAAAIVTCCVAVVLVFARFARGKS